MSLLPCVVGLARGRGTLPSLISFFHRHRVSKNHNGPAAKGLFASGMGTRTISSLQPSDPAPSTHSYVAVSDWPARAVDRLLAVTPALLRVLHSNLPYPSSIAWSASVPVICSVSWTSSFRVFCKTCKLRVWAPTSFSRQHVSLLSTWRTDRRLSSTANLTRVYNAYCDLNGSDREYTNPVVSFGANETRRRGGSGERDVVGIGHGV